MVNVTLNVEIQLGLTGIIRLIIMTTLFLSYFDFTCFQIYPVKQSHLVEQKYT